MSSPTAPARRTARRVNKIFVALFALALFAALVGAMFVNPARTSASSASGADKLDLNKTPVPDYNVNLGKSIVRLPTPAQLQALNTLKANLGDANVTARWDKTTGSVDTVMDFASQPSTLEPEAAARDFIGANSASGNVGLFTTSA